VAGTAAKQKVARVNVRLAVPKGRVLFHRQETRAMQVAAQRRPAVAGTAAKQKVARVNVRLAVPKGRVFLESNEHVWTIRPCDSPT